MYAFLSERLCNRILNGWEQSLISHMFNASVRYGLIFLSFFFPEKNVGFDVSVGRHSLGGLDVWQKVKKFNEKQERVSGVRLRTQYFKVILETTQKWKKRSGTKLKPSENHLKRWHIFSLQNDRVTFLNLVPLLKKW